MYFLRGTGPDMNTMIHNAVITSTSVVETPAPEGRIAIARGDGIGPEITDAVVAVLEAAGAGLESVELPMGEAEYLAGHASGIAPDTWERLRRQRVLLKAPLTTPQGGGYKSLNVTLRKRLGLFANVRPCTSYAPVLAGPARMDVVVIRENEEDTYAGIEHRQTDEVMQCLKLITRPGCERIARYAFAWARANGRRRITCLTKDNIMKMTDGLFHKVFLEVARDYPEIETEHLIVDIGTARIATRPERFDVILAPNLYGDIISDVAAEVAGSIGLAPSANIGPSLAMFEAVHGSAPDIAGRDIANPSGLLLSAVMMLVHIGRNAVAEHVHNAWLRTLEDGVHTADVAGPTTRQRVGTQAFAREVVARLGETPQRLAPVSYPERAPLDLAAITARPATASPSRKTLVGVDVFMHWDVGDRDPELLARVLREAADGLLDLKVITNRGVKVWPEGLPETFRTDHWRCRFVARPDRPVIDNVDVVLLLGRLQQRGLDFVKCEQLYDFDGVPGYSQAQGQ
jgi:isocitrate dehydrogenase